MFLSLLKNKKIILAIFLLLFLAVGFLAGFLLGNEKPRAPINLRENNPDYKFINPLLLFDISSNEAFDELGPLKDQFSKYASESLREHRIDNISIYFRDLNSGRWTGINENEKYSPASMLKLVTLIASIRKLETDPTLLTKTVALTADSADLNVDQTYPPKNPVKPGSVYTINELISRMIINSDNNATALLNEFIGKDLLEKVFNDLKLSPVDPDSFNISAIPFSRLLRVLYNSSYLSHSLSEQTLSLLSKTNFDAGLVAGLPSGTVISHKFGERINYDSKGNVTSHELHDCGIIYTKEPYLLCVMTRGTDFKSLEGIISGASKLVWEYVSENKISGDKN